MLEVDRATDIGNTHKKFGKERACGSRDILLDRQTDRQMHSSQYFATAFAGKVIKAPSIMLGNTVLLFQSSDIVV